MKTASSKNFAKVPAEANIKRSVFQRDSTHKTTFNASELVPFYLDEVLPGDTFDVSTSFVCRTTTPIFPVMDDAEVEMFYFYVPNRIVWDGWTKLHGENKSSAWVPSTQPNLVPTLQPSINIPVGSVADYFGLPPESSVLGDTYTELPFRGYRLIYNEWFRDQNLQAPLPINFGNDSSPMSHTLEMMPLRVCKKHDYFTSCMPQPQKGDAVQIPIFGQGSSDVNYYPVIAREHKVSGLEPFPMLMSRTDGGDISEDFNDNFPLSIATGYGDNNIYDDHNGFVGQIPAIKPGEYPLKPGAEFHPSNLWAKIGGGSAGVIGGASVTEVRQAFQLQKLYERDARSGTRYTEILSAHYGVKSQDSRLQRPEYLGGHKEYLNMEQVAQTSSTDETSPQGNLAAYSLTSSRRNSFKHSFTEHGYVFGLMTVRSRKTYSQGVERMWQKLDRFDYYYPALAHISEQPVYLKEIVAGVNNQSANADEVFGYQEAWAEYRYKPNRVSGYMRPYINNNLGAWHYGDVYNTFPNLSDTWILDNTKENLDRTLAVQSSVAPQLLIDILIKNRSYRPLPVYSIPGYVDHF